MVLSGLQSRRCGGCRELQGLQVGIIEGPRFTGLWLAGNEGMEKNMETPIGFRVYTERKRKRKLVI